jgi:hypothetical protein
MKTIWVVIGCLLLVASLASAQNDGAAGAAPAPVATAPAAINAGQVAAPAGAAKNAVGSAKGYLKTTPEAEALWKQLGQAESDLHQKKWELYVLLNAETRDKAATRAKLAEVRALMVQTRKVRADLKAYWLPLDTKGLGGGKAGRGHKGNGKGNADKGKDQAPAAAPTAPAPAN